MTGSRGVVARGRTADVAEGIDAHRAALDRDGSIEGARAAEGERACAGVKKFGMIGHSMGAATAAGVAAA